MFGTFSCLKDTTVRDEYIVYNFELTDIFGDVQETCYRIYHRVTEMGHNSSGKPTGYETTYEHIGIADTLY